jgi:MFS family permease
LAHDVGKVTDAHKLMLTRAVRGVADGVVSVALASYLTGLGMGAVRVGAIVTGTLLGSAAVTLGVGLLGYRLSRRRILVAAAALMALTGIGFAGLTAFSALMIVAVAGTLNPSAGDVSVFLPTEQAALAETASGPERTTAFAWYNLAGGLAGALGALASGLPAAAAKRWGVSLLQAERGVFVFYAAAAVAAAAIYARLSPALETHPALRPSRPLDASRSIVLRLAALFSLDSFGGGFVVQSLLVLWLVRRFALDARTLAGVFFAAGTLSAFSQVLSPRVAARIGLVRTMVYTHLPSNLLLILAALVPTAPLSIACLLARMAISQMDVPARQAFVMAVVPPEERGAAASVTNVPRSLAAGLAPLLTGVLLQRTTFGWPLVIGGTLKAIYDIALLVQFRSVRTREAGVD